MRKSKAESLIFKQLRVPQGYICAFNAVLKVQHINIQCLRTCCTFSTARKNIWEPRVKTLGYINARLSV